MRGHKDSREERRNLFKTLTDHFLQDFIHEQKVRPCLVKPMLSAGALRKGLISALVVRENVCVYACDAVWFVIFPM